MRAAIPALFLAAAAVFQTAAASECLRETAPEVIPWLASGEQAAVRAAITALDQKRDGLSPVEAAPWLTAQASMLLDVGDITNAREHLGRALQGWPESGRVKAEVCARHLLAYALSLQSEPRLALAEIRLAEERALDAGLDWQLNRLRQTRASLLLSLNERLEEALLLFELIDPGQTPVEQIGWHHLHGLILGRTNRHREAAVQFEQMLKLAEDESLGRTAATARNNLANQLANLPAKDLYPGEAARIISLLEEVLADSQAHSSTHAMALTLLARRQPKALRKPLLESCVAHARSAGDPRREAVCIADLAALAMNQDLKQAMALMDEAVFLAGDDLRAIWQIQARRLDLIWATRPPPQAFSDSISAIAGERQLRERQLAGPDRAQFIAGLMWDFRRLADRAYAHVNDHPELAWRALELIESNRAVVLRERRRTTVTDVHEQRLGELARRINQLQRELVEASGDDQRVEQLRGERARLELDWRQAAIEEPDVVELVAGPAIELLRSELSEKQAILSFLTTIPGASSRPGYGWLHVIHRDGWGLYSIPDADHLRTAGELLAGFSDWQTGPAVGLLDTLGAALLGSAFKDLPDAIDHLTIVPDRGIEAIPMAALPLPDKQLLGLAYELDMAPSASWWFSSQQDQGSSGRALVLADPQLPEVGYRALDAAFPAERFEQLPGARMEARKIQRILGKSRVDSYYGAAASESLLREQELPVGTRLIHFATHTLIHPDRADASAIVLAGSGDGVDGLLQPREIEAQQLAGIAVVLANCASATGRVLDTEGVVSLARSFLIAGSPGVIATRQAVDDRNAQVYFERLYRHLAAGSTLSQAMRQARIELHLAGYPPQVWSAYELHGRGDWHPVKLAPRWPGPALIMIGLLCLIVAGYGMAGQRKA